MSTKLLFIIAVKYYKTYKNYINLYIDNINKFYEDSLIILVDNNSKYIDDVKCLIKDYTNVKLLNNDLTCKFELGAYNKGIQYVLSNNICYDYIIFSQDTFVSNKKYDFNKLKENNNYAVSFNHCLTDYANIFVYMNDKINIDILNKIGLYNDKTSYSICWCNSFVLHNTKVQEYYDIVKDIVITRRFNGSVQSERFLSNILYLLNNRKHDSLCGLMDTCDILGYECWTVDIENNNLPHFFVKTVQQKTEKTLD